MNPKNISHIQHFFWKLQHNISAEEIREFCDFPPGGYDPLLPNIQQKTEFTETTKSHHIWSKKYLKKAHKWLPFFRFLPGVRAVAVCNTVALGTADKNSDIDLFIITASGKLWTARIFCTLFCQILRIRRHHKKVAGRFCLSFFVTENFLDFEKIAIEPRDPYLAFWISSLIPIFGKEVFKKILEKNKNFVQNNGGIGIRFENEKNMADFLKDVKDEKDSQLSSVAKEIFQVSVTEKNEKIIPSKQREMEGNELRGLLKKQNATAGQAPLLKKVGEFLLGSWFESLVKKIFLPRTLKKKAKLKDQSGTIVEDDILKFHNSDRRREFSWLVSSKKNEQKL